MIEAGIIALAILIVGIAAIVVYRKEQAANRDRIAGLSDNLYRITGCLADLGTAQRKLVTATENGVTSQRIIMSNLGPLCSGLAESLQAQMSTIDREMADLRTRVETGPGKRTLRV